MVGQGNYKYYKLRLACVEAAQQLTFTLTASNGNPDVYVSRTEERPTTSSYAFKSTDAAAADVVEIPNPEAGMYYVGVYGTTTATFKLRANTKMFTGKHPCRGFRLMDSEPEERNSDGSFLLENAMTVTGGANFESTLSVAMDVALGDAETDNVAIKGQVALGVAGPSEYVMSRQDAAANESAGALLIRGARGFGADAGNVSVVAGAGTDAKGGSLRVFAGDANNASAGDLTLGTGRATSGRAGNVAILVDLGDVGSGGNVSAAAGATNAANAHGGSVNVVAGSGANVTGGGGGVVRMRGGRAAGKRQWL